MEIATQKYMKIPASSDFASVSLLNFVMKHPQLRVSTPPPQILETYLRYNVNTKSRKDYH